MTKHEAIKQHLLEGKSITPMEALRLYGSFRLASIVHRLKKEGLDIVTRREKTLEGTYARYSIRNANNTAGNGRQ